MPKRKKQIVDVTDHVEAPAKVTLEPDTARTLQLVGFAQACLASVVPLLTKYDLGTAQFMDLTSAVKNARPPLSERRKMAIKYLRRSLEITEQAISALGEGAKDESNSW